MTDLYALYGVFLLCCLLECTVFANGQPVLITRAFWNWRVFRFAGIRLGKGKQLLFLNPLPWLAEWHTVPRLPVTPADGGIVPASSLYGSLRDAEGRGRNEPADFHLTFDAEGRLALAVPSAEEQAALHALYAEQGLPPGQSGFSEADLLRWTDPEPLLAKRNRIRVHLRILQVCCTLQLCAGLAFGPLLLADFPLPFVIMGCLAGLYTLGFCVAVVFILAWRRLVPGGILGLGKALWMQLYPPAAMRAIQTLSAAMRVPCHESAVMLALASQGPAGQAYLADTLARLRYCVFSRSLAPEAVAALERANQELAKAILRHWKPEQEPVLVSPKDMEPGTLCYCPLCGVSLAVAMEYCPQCLDVRTLKTSPPQSLREFNT